ncbi:MAG TPA: MFS transporter [Myxococcota bacterium]|nr:MFS transporter [Myxococcota bacterium]
MTHKYFESDNAATIKGVAWMSFLWSMSTLMVFSVLGAFLEDELKMGHLSIGIIEGVAISSSFLSKFFSGYLSDVIKRRKPLIVFGSLMSAVTKPLFAICYGPGLLFFARFFDRLSKGIRSAPTDALIADLSGENSYASNFGYRQSLYTLGQVAGALTAMSVLLISGNNYRLLFSLAVIPIGLATLLLCVAIRPNPDTHPRTQNEFAYQKIKVADFKKFSPAFWWLMMAFFFLMLARFSETFLTLKAKGVGFGVAYLPLIIVIMDLVHSSVAWPAGKFADRFSREQMLAIGLIFMVAAQAVLAYVTTVPGVIAGMILVGLAMGTTQGLLKALIAQSTPPELRGTAFSLSFVISGFALFLGNTIAGNLSHAFGLFATFLGGTFFSSVSVAILYAVFLRQKIKSAAVVG